MTDDGLMPFGKFQGEKMANVPASYLIWLYENQEIYGELKEYIIKNMDVLKQQADYARRLRER